MESVVAGKARTLVEVKETISDDALVMGNGTHDGMTYGT